MHLLLNGFLGLNKYMKKLLSDKILIELLHKLQGISILGFSISLLSFFTCLDIFHHNSIILLGLMMLFLIIFVAIGFFWLVQDISSFSKAYKAIYYHSIDLKQKQSKK